MNKEALKLAHDAIGAYMSATDSEEDAKAHSLMAEAFFKIKEALAQPEQTTDKCTCKHFPLTDEDLIGCERLAGIRHRIHMGSIRGQQLSPADQFLWHYARAIEAAHGIKE